MFRFIVTKSPDVSNETFESALNCAKTSIESVIDNEKLIVRVIDNSIIVSKKNALDASSWDIEYKSLLKASFCDSYGNIYPEFISVLPEPLQK